jgi:hypothetical protein
MWPREHGAYVQLLVPLATALVIGPSIAGVLFAIAACSAFLAHEALMVARGARGVRRSELDGARAAGRVRLWGTIAVGTTIAAIVHAPRPAVQLLAPVALPIALVAIEASRRALRTLAGEVLAATALSGAAVPVAASGGLSRTDVVLLWAAWSIGFAATVVVVRDVLANHRRTRAEARGVTVLPRRTAFALLSLAGWLGIATLIVPLAAVAIPLVVAGLVIDLAGPSARSLRAVGIALACTSAVSGAIAVYVA